MAVKTGRSRTLSVSGPFNATCYAGGLTHYDAHGRFTIHQTVSAYGLSAQVAGEMDWTAAPPVTETGGDPAYTWTMTAAGVGPTDIHTSDTQTGTSAPPTGDGSFSLSLPVEEWMDITLLSTTTGGIIDAPPRIGVTFYEMPVIGGTLTVTASLWGASATHTEVISAASIVGYFVTQNSSLSYDTADSAGSVANLKTRITSGPAVGGSASYSDANVSVSTGGGTSLSYTSPRIQTGSATVSAGGAPPKSFSLTGVIYAVNQGYPGSVTLYCPKYLGDPSPYLYASPGFSAAYTQAWYSSGYTITGSSSATGGDGMNDWAPIGVVVDGPWCLANNQYVSDSSGNIYDSSVQMHGYTFPGLSLSQATSLSVDLCTSATNWTGAAAAGGGLQNTAASMVRTFSPSVNLSGYRYLRVRIKTSGGSHPFTLTLGSKTWTRTANATATDYDIDLCDPDNDTTLVDLTDTRWPLGTATDGPLWGVGMTSSLTLSGLASGITYTLLGLTQVRHTSVQASFLPTWAPRFDTDMIEESPAVTSGDTTTTGKLRRFVVADTDGRQSLEYRDVVAVQVDGPGGTTYSLLQAGISDMAFSGAITSEYPGWTGTALGPAPDGSNNLHDGYLNTSSPAGWLQGGGLLYSGGGWQTGVGLDGSGTLTVPAQMLFDRIDWYPGIGDVFGLGGSTGDGGIILAASKIFSGQAHGIVLLDGHGPSTAKAVTLTQPAFGTAVYGSDTSATPEGSYRTDGLGVHGESGGSPAPGIVNCSLRTGTQTFWTRHLSRVALRVAPTLSFLGPASLGVMTDNFQRVVASAAGVVFVRSISGTPSAHMGTLWDVGPVLVTTMATDRNPCLAADSRFLYCGWERTAGTYLSRSGDNGKTWEVESLAITGGTFPRIDADGGGRIINAALVSAGGGLYHIQGQFQGPGDAHFGATFAFIDETATALSMQNTGFDVAFTRSGTNALILSALIAGEAATSEWVCYNIASPAPSWKRIPTS